MTTSAAPTIGPSKVPAPPEIVTPSSTPKQYESPLLDGKLPSEELLPPVVAEGRHEDGVAKPGVQPYGGGHPTDWSWGCNGNPYRTGPGLCDNYRIGPRWHVTVDGMVMHREGTDLTALVAQMRANNAFMSGDGTDVGGDTKLPPASDNFHYAPALSDATPECEWAGFEGFVHDAAKARFNGDFRGHKAYLCGPPVMIEACIRTLMQGRLFERDIYTEKFLTNADGADGLARSPLFRSI